MNAPDPKASIAVLAGGMSRRMGEDKAMLRLVPEDSTLLGVVINRVRYLTDDLFVVAPERPGYSEFGIRVVPDHFPDSGPLGGIATALSVAEHDRCLVVSCDHPFLSTPLLRHMLTLDGSWDALIPIGDAPSRQGTMRVRHTAHAVYSKSCLPAIKNAISMGQLRSIAFLPDVRVEELEPEVQLRFDPLLRSLFSVNTREDLAIARDWRAEEIRKLQESVDQIN